MFASASSDGTVKLWVGCTPKAQDTVSNRCTNTIPLEGVVNTVEFSTNQKYLLTYGSDSTIRIWDLATGRSLVSLPTGAKTVHSPLTYRPAMPPFLPTKTMCSAELGKE